MNSSASPVTGKPDKSPVPPESLPPRRIDSEALFQGSSRVIIVHNDSDYCLLVTRNGKLILTK